MKSDYARELLITAVEIIAVIGIVITMLSQEMQEIDFIYANF